MTLNLEPKRTKNRDGSWTITWVDESPWAPKETQMSADIDEEGTAAAFDLENGWPNDGALRQHIVFRYGNKESTHYPGCWASHPACGLYEILRLRGYIRKLEGEVVGVHEEVEGHEELVEELDRLNEDKQNLIGELHNMTTQRDELVHEMHELHGTIEMMGRDISNLQDCKYNYIHAMEAVRALARIRVPPETPKG